MYNRGKVNYTGELITLAQACELSNLGATTIRQLASDAGAVRKIGRNYRIHRKIFFDYIEQHYSQAENQEVE